MAFMRVRAPTDPLRRASLRGATVFSVGLALVALVAGGVRLLPWLFDSSVPWTVAAPFARSVATLALEVALLVGWPLGWAVATARFAERGEARVLALLGERPRASAARLLPQAAWLAIALGVVSYAAGRDARAPGEVVNRLVHEGAVVCAKPSAPRVVAVPFLGASWLCAPGFPERLVAEAPVAHGTFVTAKDARLSGDLARIDLDDAHLALPRGGGGGGGASGGRAFGADVHVARLALRGLPPWTHAARLPAWARALVTCASAAVSALFVAWLLVGAASRASALGRAGNAGNAGGVRRARGGWLAARAAAAAGEASGVEGGGRASRVATVVLGVAGPLAALGWMRALDRSTTLSGGGATALYGLAPVVALAALVVLAKVMRLLPGWAPARKNR